MHVGLMTSNMGFDQREPFAGISLFQRSQGFVYRGPTVRGVESVTPPAGTVKAPAMLSAPEAASQVTGHEVMKALAPVLEQPVRQAPAETSTAAQPPRTAAQRILGAVGETLQAARQQGADDQALGALLDQARAGVEQGVAEARDVLAGMGVTGGSLMAQVDETEAALQEGLAALAAQFAPVPASEAFEGALAMAAGREQSLSLEITTREGDVVTLALSSSRGMRQEAMVSMTADGSLSMTTSRQVYASSNFSLTVAGDLNAEELEAIQGLMKKVDKLADRFFEHGMQGALEKVLAMDLDSETLASFSLDMSMSITRQASVSYQSVAAMTTPDSPRIVGSQPAGPPAPESAAAVPDPATAPGTAPQREAMVPSLAEALDTLSGLMRDMKEAMGMSEMEHAFSRPGKIFRQLLGEAVALHPAHDEAAGLLGVSPRAVVDDITKGLEEVSGAEQEVDVKHGEAGGHEERH